MDPQPWLNELEKELQQRRLPRRYVMRLMRELSDHVTDELAKPMSKEDQRSTDLRERLGTPQGLAESAKQEYQSRTFAVRHPIWTFGVFPPLLFLILAIGIYIVSAPLFASLFNFTSLGTQQNTRWTEVFAQGFFIGCIVLASLVVTVVFAEVRAETAVADDGCGCSRVFLRMPVDRCDQQNPRASWQSHYRHFRSSETEFTTALSMCSFINSGCLDDAQQICNG